jgi:RecQ family ATP-dependent DNA helicase
MQTVLERVVEDTLDERLQGVLRLFGFDQFSTEQDALIRASIAGQDVLGILPTGSGKSACFQIPGIMTGAKTLVVSPLIALQDDQVQALRRLGVKAFALHSGLSEARKMAVHYYFSTAPAGEPSFLYLSPELLLTETFHQRFDAIRFDRLVVDEAHCVSTWGDAFRPNYQRIRVATQRLRIPHRSAFTATTDPKIKRDIRMRIPLRPGFLTVEADPMRPNLLLSVERPTTALDNTVAVGKKRLVRFLQLLAAEKYAGPTIVYFTSRDGAYRAFMRMQRGIGLFFARRHGYSSYLFHAALPYEDKERALQGFLADEQPIVFATSAFGMGINRADVRQIIHYDVPQTLIDYAQQIGRAGRDGLPALCTTFMRRGDTFKRQLEQARWAAPTYDFVEYIHRNLIRAISKRPTMPERRRYDIQSFMHSIERRVRASDKIQYKETYLTRAHTAVAMLQRIGIIHEDGDGLAVYQIMPGTRQHAALLERTQMHARMLVREQERLKIFFGAPHPDQRKLWNILRTDSDIEPSEEQEEQVEP